MVICSPLFLSFKIHLFSAIFTVLPKRRREIADKFSIEVINQGKWEEHLKENTLR